MTKNSMEPVKKIECADLDRILPTVEIKIVQKLSQRKYLAVRCQSRKKYLTVGIIKRFKNSFFQKITSLFSFSQLPKKWNHISIIIEWIVPTDLYKYLHTSDMSYQYHSKDIQDISSWSYIATYVGKNFTRLVVECQRLSVSTNWYVG